MNKTPQELVIRFIETRDAIRAVFRWESEYIYPACAHIFLAADRAVDRERLERCKAMVKAPPAPSPAFGGTSSCRSSACWRRGMSQRPGGRGRSGPTVF